MGGTHMANEVFKKILFLTDGSDPALSAQELAILLAKKLGSAVTVFHVVTHELMRPGLKEFLMQGRGIPESADAESGVVAKSEMAFETETPTSPGAHYSERIEDELTGVYRQQGEDIAADAALTFKEEGVHAEQKVVERKSVVEAVMEEVDGEDHDLIVMGRNGQKEKESHLGSVAEKVSRHSAIPVLVAGEKATKSISKVLVPLDGSKSSENALICADALSKKLNAALTVLHVQESHIFDLRPEVTRAIGKGILAGAAEKLKETSLEQKLESGDPAKKISEIAEKEGFDIIVMGSKGDSSTDRSALGSVSSHVLHYTTLPVLIVK
jgi:nucleotide-binding universal stress UspA family protein